MDFSPQVYFPALLAGKKNSSLGFCLLFVWALIILGVTELEFIGTTQKAAICKQLPVFGDYFGVVSKQLHEASSASLITSLSEGRCPEKDELRLRSATY